MFSVIVPVHNKLPHLERSINSVLNQSFKDFELLLIDDASTDGSTEKLLEFNDTRIKKFRREEPGPGGYAARNLGIKEAKYEWIAFLDADDEWNENYLKEMCKAILANEDVRIVSSKWLKSNNGKLINNGKWKRFKTYYHSFDLVDFLEFNSIIWTSAVVINKNILIKSGLFPAGKCRRGGDLDTWIRCLQISESNIFINKTLATYYIDTVNQVTDITRNPSNKLCSYETLQRIRENNIDEKLLESIDSFYSRYVYFSIVDNFRSTKQFDYSKLKIINSNRIKIKVFLKATLYNLLVLFKIK